MYEENGYKRVKKWTKKVNDYLFFFLSFHPQLTCRICTVVLQFDVFEKDIIIFPINIRNSHWTCAAVNVKEKRFEYYDSLGNRMQKAHTLLRKWLQEEHECKKGSKIDLSDWVDYWDPVEFYYYLSTGGDSSEKADCYVTRNRMFLNKIIVTIVVFSLYVLLIFITH